MTTTNWSDEELMAYADGQLAGERRAPLAAAIAADAALRQRVEALAAQRRRVAAAFADVLDEPVPQRLSALLSATPAPAVVTDLAAERERRAARKPGLSWAHWGGMAASVALGVVLGLQLGSRSGGAGSDALLSEAGGQVVAGARLAQALDTQVGAEATAGDAGVTVQLTFVAKDGRYCRTFSAERVAGLACRDAAQWAVQTTVAAEGAASGAAAGMRQAASALPRAVLEAVDARIEGVALTVEQEHAAREKAWKR